MPVLTSSCFHIENNDTEGMYHSDLSKFDLSKSFILIDVFIANLCSIYNITKLLANFLVLN